MIPRFIRDEKNGGTSPTELKHMRLFCATGQPQLSTLPFCVDRRQRIALAYQWDHPDTGSLLLPEGSRYAKAGGLAG